MTAFITITNPWVVLALSYLLPLAPLAVFGVLAARRGGGRS